MLAEELVQHLRIPGKFAAQLDAVKADFRGIGQHGLERRIATQFGHIVVDPGNGTYTETDGHHSPRCSLFILSS